MVPDFKELLSVVERDLVRTRTAEGSARAGVYGPVGLADPDETIGAVLFLRLFLATSTTAGTRWPWIGLLRAGATQAILVPRQGRRQHPAPMTTTKPIASNASDAGSGTVEDSTVTVRTPGTEPDWPK